jgi:hypothetical protein
MRVRDPSRFVFEGTNLGKIEFHEHSSIGGTNRFPLRWIIHRALFPSCLRNSAAICFALAPAFFHSSSLCCGIGRITGVFLVRA